MMAHNTVLKGTQTACISEFLQGIVKGATKEFPAKYQRGDHQAATATIEGVPMIALAWKDKTLKRFLSTCGTTVEGQPHTKKRYRVSEDGESSEIFCKTLKRPKLVEEYFDSTRKIDVHSMPEQRSSGRGPRCFSCHQFGHISRSVPVEGVTMEDVSGIPGSSKRQKMEIPWFL